MSRLQNPPDGISQEALADLVAEAVQQALTQHGVLLDAEALASASKIAGHVAAALPFLPPAQRLAIASFKGAWTGLVADFFRATADRIASDGSAVSDRVFERAPPKPETARPTPPRI
ncbi:MAG: hypothetical protein J0H31_23625, partial [Alphaproteobacteria bacterium]|nr:hypothetical protein [Alphaproteobacteria bacterium]